MAPREIVTVQLGGYANFVGAHFWNFQVGDFFELVKWCILTVNY